MGQSAPGRNVDNVDGRWSTPRRIGGGGGGPMYRCGMHLGRNRGLGLLGHPEDVKKALFTVISNQGRRIQLDGGRAGGSREKPLDDRSDVNKANSRIKDKKPSEGENDENKSTAADPRVCTSTHGKSLPSVPLQYGTRGVRMGGGGASDLAQRAYRWGEPRGQGPRRMRRWVVERRG